MNREDFPMLKNNIIYFDNGATTLKPKVMIDSIVDYYSNYSANAHRGSYDISLKVNKKYEHTRDLVKEFINAKKREEIIFTSGTTDSINKIVFGYFRNVLKPGDEILLNKSEHASNVLPWFELADSLDLKIKFIDLNDDYSLNINSLENLINENTKVLSIASITNVVGDTRDLKKAIDICHKHNILVLVDAAQSMGHLKINVTDLDIDFLAFSAHKMYGPTGVGVLYGKEELLKNIKPIIFGGGMNSSYGSDMTRIYDELPELLEAGTQNIAGVIGLGRVIEYLNEIGLDNITKYEHELKEYAISKLKNNANLIIYNQNIKGNIITLNYKDVFAEDLANYLNKYKICVRAGNHCSKILKDELNIKNTVRISLAFYNTKEEIDTLVKALENPNLKKDFL